MVGWDHGMTRREAVVMRTSKRGQELSAWHLFCFDTRMNEVAEGSLVLTRSVTRRR